MRFAELLIEKKITAPDGTVYTSVDQLVQDYMEYGYDFEGMMDEIGDQVNVIRVAYFARQRGMKGSPRSKEATNKFKDMAVSNSYANIKPATTNAKMKASGDVPSKKEIKSGAYNRYADMTKPERLKLISKVIVQIQKNNDGIEKFLVSSDNIGAEENPKFVALKTKLDNNLTRLREYERDMNFQWTGDAVVWTAPDDMYPSERSAKSVEREEKIGLKKSENQKKRNEAILKLVKKRNFAQNMYNLIDDDWLVPEKIKISNEGKLKEEIVVLFNPVEKRYVAVKPNMGKVDTFAMSRAQSNQMEKDLGSTANAYWKRKKLFRTNLDQVVKLLGK